MKADNSKSKAHEMAKSLFFSFPPSLPDLALTLKKTPLYKQWYFTTAIYS